MDYVVGSVAALITSGNVTPNRPRPLKRALTPTKHQPSPNVTPKSEFVDDRSIFLSPTLQKKKAIVKKSPKRIFQNPDLDVTNEGDIIAEKAEKVKKHLKEDLDADKMVAKSPKTVKGKMNNSIEGKASKLKTEPIDSNESIETAQSNNENTPKKKKKQRNSVSQSSEIVTSIENSMDVDLNIKQESPGTPKKKKTKNNSVSEQTECENKENLTTKTDSVNSSAQNTPKKKKRRNKNNKLKSSPESTITLNKQTSPDEQDGPKISKKRKLSESITWKLNEEETELDADKMVVRSPKKVKGEMIKSIDGKASKIKAVSIDANESIVTIQSNNENTPKKKKQRNSVSQSSETVKSTDDSVVVDLNSKQESPGTPKKKKKQKSSAPELTESDNKENLTTKTDSINNSAQNTPKKKKRKNKKNKPKSSPESTITLNKQKSPDEQDGPKISKKRKLSESITWELNEEEALVTEANNNQQKSKKKNKGRNKSKSQIQSEDADKTKSNPQIQKERKPNKKKGNKNNVNTNATMNEDSDSENEIDSENEGPTNEIVNNSLVAESSQQTSKNKNKKKKKSKQSQSTDDKNLEIESNLEVSDKKKKKGNKSIVNPNAITSRDSDSEHESDNEINSENEEANNAILNAGSFEESSDEDDKEEGFNTKTVGKKEGGKKAERVETNVEELERTLFVGNVVFSPKCKKEIKRIFAKHGDIETVRVRAVPIKDARLTPKVAAIKNELHPERSTVNVYVKFQDAASVESALVENNTLYRDKHLRVTRSISTGQVHDPKASVFVGNLPLGLEDEGLWEKFEKCGEIDSVRIIRDKKTSIGKGFGYVNFKSKDAVELALALTEEDLTIKNRILRVKRCTQTDKQTNRSIEKSSSNHGTRGINRGRGFSDRGGMNRGGQSSFSDRGQGDWGGFRGRGGHRGGRGGQRGGRGGYSFKRGEDGQTFNYQRGRTEKDDIGAFRRIQNKRQHQERGTDGPPSKKPRTINQPPAPPGKEKKPRKQFVGMTAEKKKKHKNTKSQGMRQKKALSEILSK